MIAIWHGVRGLYRGGRIHGRLTGRLVLLYLATVVLFGITVYDIAQGASVAISILCTLVGAVIGYYLLSHEDPLRWNEEVMLVEARRLTIVGWVVVGLFFLLKIAATIALAHVLPAGAEAYLFAAFFGFLLGRLLGMYASIRRLTRV